jgi:hypothetical protein
VCVSSVHFQQCAMCYGNLSKCFCCMVTLLKECAKGIAGLLWYKVRGSAKEINCKAKLTRFSWRGYLSSETRQLNGMDIFPWFEQEEKKTANSSDGETCPEDRGSRLKLIRTIASGSCPLAEFDVSQAEISSCHIWWNFGWNDLDLCTTLYLVLFLYF